MQFTDADVTNDVEEYTESPPSTTTHTTPSPPPTVDKQQRQRSTPAPLIIPPPPAQGIPLALRLAAEAKNKGRPVRGPLPPPTTRTKKGSGSARLLSRLSQSFRNIFGLKKVFGKTHAATVARNPHRQRRPKKRRYKRHSRDVHQVACPSQQLFVHPRVAFSVNGKLKRFGCPILYTHTYFFIRRMALRCEHSW